ncbi:MAG: nitroreductase/quinone reductase family protein [Acidimicrobiales bacterium]
MELSPRVVDLGFRSLNVLHRAIVWVSAGRLGRRAFGMDVVELATVGRRTGRPHVTLLTVPVVEGDALVLVASKGGDDRDPDWLKNLIEHPTVEVTRGGVRRAMYARLASSAEYASLWPQVVASYRHYDSYRRRAARPIPLVICTPRGAESPGPG